MPLIPILLYGGTAAIVGGAGYGAYSAASEGTKAVILTGALLGMGYLIYKRGK